MSTRTYLCILVGLVLFGNCHISAQNQKFMLLKFHAVLKISATKEAIFDVISDHENTPSWVKDVKSVKLIQQGQPKNGLGAIREVNFKPRFWTTVQEKIISYSENISYSYSILKMPAVIEHLGKWSLAEEGDQIEVSWKVNFKLKKVHWFTLFFAKKFARDFRKIQEKALYQLKINLEG